MKLSEIAKLKVGINPTYRKNSNNWYSLRDLNDDMLMNFGQVNYEEGNNNFNSNLTFKGELVFGMVKNKVALVSSKNANKMLGINFIHISLDISRIDSWYFMYYINESVEFQHQLAINTTNSILKRITGKQFGNCNIEVPSLEKQKIIGKLYQLKLKYSVLLQKEDKLIDQLLRGLNQKGNE